MNLKQIARLETKLFRLKHPDIKPNSPQEKRIARLIRNGEQLEIAYKIVKYFYTQKKLARSK